MKKRVIYLLALMILIPINAKAVNVSVNINCRGTTVGETATCSIIGNTGGSVSSIKGTISISGAGSIQGFNKGSGWSGDGDVSTFELYTDTDKTGNFTIGSVLIKNDAPGTVNLLISNIKAYGGLSENYEEFNVSNAQGIYIAKEITTTTTTTLPPTSTTTARTEKVIDPKTTTQKVEVTEANTTMPIIEPLKLISVTVDEFEVSYIDGKYYVTTLDTTESVIVNATAEDGITILGTGKRMLTQGKNVVELVLTNDANQSNVYQVIITRPEGNGITDTKLSKIKVVDYDLSFDPDTLEYVLKVPYNTKEIYIIAASSNKDIVITGAGLKVLTSGNNDIYIKSSYGDKSSTEYVIHVKRSYNNLFLIVGIGITTLGMGISIFMGIKGKKRVTRISLEEKNKILADNKRFNQIATPEATINGSNVVGVGSSPVAPVKVVDVRKEETQNTLVQSTPEPQIKVIKTGVTNASGIKTAPLSGTDYKKEEIVITNLK